MIKKYLSYIIFLFQIMAIPLHSTAPIRNPSLDDELPVMVCHFHQVIQYMDDTFDVRSFMVDLWHEVEHNFYPINTKDQEGYTLLHRAIQVGHDDLACQLIDLGVDTNMPTPEGSYPLHMALEIGLYNTFCHLINHHAQINQVNSQGLSPLHKAITMRSCDYFIRLLHAGADVNQCNAQGAYPLHLVIKLCDRNQPENNQDLFQMAEWLLYFGADANSTNHLMCNWTPLHAAAACNNPVMYNLLLRNGADPSLRTAGFKTPLMVARERSSLRVLEFFDQPSGRELSRDLLM